MPRRLHFQAPGAIYDVTSRGTEGRDVFLDDLDRRLFLYVLAEVVRCGVAGRGQVVDRW